MKRETTFPALLIFIVAGWAFGDWAHSPSYLPHWFDGLCDSVLVIVVALRIWRGRSFK